MELKNILQNLNRNAAQKIRQIEREEKDVLKRMYLCAQAINEANSRLKSFVMDYEFADEQEEIWFFKEVKPALVSQFIYYCHVYNVELNRPIGDNEVQRDYLSQRLASLQNNIDQHSEFYSYYRLRFTHNDVCYFTRDKFIAELQYPEYMLDEREPKYSTNCDYKLARIMANDMLRIYLLSELDEPNNTIHNPASGAFPKARLTWTGSKTDLIELIYALDTEVCFDHGKIPLTQIASYFENVFNIDLGNNIARNFYDMRIRQQPTPFLDRLKIEILKRMENPKYKTDKHHTGRVYNSK